MDSELMLGNIAGKIGRGLAAGLAGTAAMTISQGIEMQLSGRQPSAAPAEAASEVLGVHDLLQKADHAQKQTLSQTVHWSYGTTWGSVRALLDLLGIEGVAAALIQFFAIWGTAVIVMPRLEGSKPITEWKPEEIAVSAFRHAVYTAAVSAAYALLKQQSSENERPWYSHVLRNR